MSDRFDFLEFGDEKPRPLPETHPAGGVGVAWKSQRLRAVEVIGDPGTAAGQFSSPTGLAADRDGAILVVDSGNHRIQRIGLNGDLKVYGRAGNAPGELWGPQAITVDPAGQFFFVAEQGNNRVQCFQLNGQHRGVLSGFRSPSGVAFDTAGRLWIADTGNGRILCVDVHSGKYLGTLDGQSGVQRPISLACDARHQLYVTENAAEDVVFYRNYTQRYTSLGAYRRLHLPQQVAVDNLGRIYLAEAGSNRLHVFSQEGESLAIFEQPSTRLGPLRSPSGVALGPNGEIYVSDTLNHRVLRLAWE